MAQSKFFAEYVQYSYTQDDKPITVKEYDAKHLQAVLGYKEAKNGIATHTKEIVRIEYKTFKGVSDKIIEWYNGNKEKVRDTEYTQVIYNTGKVK